MDFTDKLLLWLHVRRADEAGAPNDPWSFRWNRGLSTDKTGIGFLKASMWFVDSHAPCGWLPSEHDVQDVFLIAGKLDFHRFYTHAT